jgi:hypothetical protein
LRTCRKWLHPNKLATSSKLAIDSRFINAINPYALFSRGGVVILTQQEPATNERGFVCPNASCRKIFTHPLKAVHVGVSTEPYDACPYCLTEIPSGTEPVTLVKQKEEQPETETASDHAEDKPAVSKSPECKHHLGFLSQRPPKTPIPDECLTCTSIVQCMLHKATTQESVSN